MQDIIDSNFDAVVQITSNEDKLLLVDFWAEWCGPCKLIHPILESVSVSHVNILTIVKLNVDDYPAVAREYDIRSIPNLLLFKNGKIVDQLVGAVSKDKLLKFLEKHKENENGK